MIYEDLTEYSKSLAKPISKILNVGWLDSSELQGANGVCDTEVADSLRDLIVGTDQINIHIMRTRGQPEKCAACDEKISLISVTGEYVDDLGVGQILIPNKQGDGYFASPSLVLHYMQCHGYQPPEQFVFAVKAFDFSVAYNAKEIFMEILLSQSAS